MVDSTTVKDRYFDHQSKAGKKGGRSRSLAKRLAARANLAMVRARRHNPVTGPQVGEQPSQTSTIQSPSPHVQEG